MFSPADLETMIWVRTSWNPKGLANPTKIFPTPRTCGEAARSPLSPSLENVERF
jgi:glycolate oxidase